MAKRILVADDSPTIRKVIGITLSDKDYQIVHAETVDALRSFLKNESFDLILLDFTLSPKISGYELATEMRKYSSAPILAMLGTFDSVDLDELNRAGIAQKIVKPFESEKFVAMCSDLLDGNFKDEKHFEVEDDGENWNVKGEFEEKYEVSEVTDSTISQAEIFESELSEWGVEIPEVIGASSAVEAVVPPVIAFDGVVQSEEKTKVVSTREERNSVENHSDEDESKFPERNDLDFPNVLEIQNEIEQEFGKSAKKELEQIRVPAGLGKLAVEELARTEKKLTQKAASPETNIVKVESLTLEKSISSKLKDENLWKPDEYIERENSVSSGAIENPEVVSELNLRGSFLNEVELLEKIRPMIREMVREFCEQKAEEISWDVIPDLAENLIKKEIQQISKSIMDQ